MKSVEDLQFGKKEEPRKNPTMRTTDTSPSSKLNLEPPSWLPILKPTYLPSSNNGSLPAECYVSVMDILGNFRDFIDFK